jgi:mutator protein MutT
VKTIDVVCAVIFNKDGNVLLAQRKEPDHLKGLWEFPGGKVEDGEDRELALHREIEEELAIKIKIARKIGEFDFDAKTFRIHLIAFEAQALTEAFQLNEHLAVHWVKPEEVSQYKLSPADFPVFPAYLKLKQ